MTSRQIELDARRFLHRPITGPRNGHIGEQVFCEKWLALQRRDIDFREVDQLAHTSKLDRILRNAQLPMIGERVCTVEASWACYLGRNVGASVITLGDRLKDGVGEYRWFLAAWAIHNTRSVGVNRGFRAIEFILAPVEHFNTAEPFALSGLNRAPDLSLTHYEVIWLGTDEGAVWLADCQREVDRRQAAAWRAEHELINSVIGESAHG